MVAIILKAYLELNCPASWKCDIDCNSERIEQHVVEYTSGHLDSIQGSIELSKLEVGKKVYSDVHFRVYLGAFNVMHLPAWKYVIKYISQDDSPCAVQHDKSNQVYQVNNITCTTMYYSQSLGLLSHSVQQHIYEMNHHPNCSITS